MRIHRCIAPLPLFLLVWGDLIQGFVVPQRVGRTSRLSAERKQRKKRKTISTMEETSPPPPVPRPSAAQLEIRDIRQVTGQQVVASSLDSDDSTNVSSLLSGGTASTTTQSSFEDPLAQLLSDAKAMQRESKSSEKDDESSGLVSQVLSTIITVDFFVVCALLLWFLAGIFCSYILKDDTVQIAFNGIFEPVVQPALGVLMIASLSDAVLKPKEDGDEQ